MVGMPTTWGIAELKDNYPSRNALAVDRLLAAGVVLFGKTNVPLLSRRLAELQRDLRHHQQSLGRDALPRRLLRRRPRRRWPRGSPASRPGATSAPRSAIPRTTAASTDTSRPGASCRRAARPCPAASRRPTSRWWDRWRAAPMIWPSALAAMAGRDEIDGAGWQLRLPAPRRRALRDWRVAVMLDDPAARVDGDVQDRLQALADFLGRRRAKVSDRARPAVDTARGPSRVHPAPARGDLRRGRRTRSSRSTATIAAGARRPATSGTTRG